VFFGALLLIAAPLAARADDEQEPAVPDPPPPTEERYEALVASFETRARRMRENPESDEVVLAEAEALAAVAQELFAEGDLETSIPLLEESIALLEIAPPQE
jgi:hypothetical protein